MELRDVKVRPLDMDKLNASLSNCEMNGRWAISVNPPALINEDCVGNHGTPLKFQAYRKCEANELEKSIAVFPEFNVEMTIDELLEYALPEKSLVEFMGRRHNYNPRIRSNQSKWLLFFINGGDK